MSPDRRAVLLLLGLAVVGQGLRVAWSRPGEAPGEVRILGSRSSLAPGSQAESVRAAVRPLAEGERIDADRASARDLNRLPRVGPALARRIVADREAHGPFGSLEGLDRVPGIGPGLLRALEPHLTFSLRARPAAPVAGRSAGPGPAALDINQAGPAELERLPLIGPSRARAIVAWRERHGRIGGESDLERVPGVSRRMVEALRGRIRF